MVQLDVGGWRQCCGALSWLPGLCVGGSARLTVQDSSVTHNDAAALVVHDNAAVVVRGSKLIGNKGLAVPGGVLVMNNASVVIHASTLQHNVATQSSGGAVEASGRSQLTITGRTVISSSSCGKVDVGRKMVCVGGGVLVADNATAFVGGSTSIHNNSAMVAGGGVAVIDSGRLVVSGRSRVCNNTLRWEEGMGGGLALMDYAQVTITDNSSVCYNFNPDGWGGGLSVQDHAQLRLANGSMVFGNSCSSELSGGGVVLGKDARLFVNGHCGIYGNYAGQGGGGLAVFDRSQAVLNGHSFVSNNTIAKGPGVSILSFAQGGAGAWVAGSASLLLGQSSVVAGNEAKDMSGGGILVGASASLVVKGGVEFANNTVGLGYVGADIAAFDKSSLSIAPGVLSQGELLTKCSANVFLGRFPCEVGEDSSAGICQC